VLAVAQNVLTDVRAAVAYDQSAADAFGEARTVEETGVRCDAVLHGDALEVHCRRIGDSSSTVHLRIVIAPEAPRPGAIENPGV
jgi:hypothetical protein